MSVIYERRDINYEAFFVDMDFYPHIHEKIEIIYVCEGIIRTKIGNVQKVMYPGDLCIVFPEIIHSYHHVEGPNYVLTLIFDAALVENYKLLLSSKCPEDPFLSAKGVHPDIIQSFNTIAVDRYWNFDQRLLQGYLTIILGQILNHFILVPREKADIFLPDLLTFLSCHYMDNLTLNDLAHQFGISKYRISRCFSQKIGCNFNSYINTLRIQHAEKMLVTTDNSITEISYQSGFESLSTFYRVFNQFYGLSPTDYKKHTKKCHFVLQKHSNSNQN